MLGVPEVILGKATGMLDLFVQWAVRGDCAREPVSAVQSSS